MMALMSSEFLVRVKPLPDGGYMATCRQLAGQREDFGPISTGVGETELAAMARALVEVRLGTVHEVRRVS